ncbi:MAG: GNAT family N-acetyltransferase [Chitinophagales bacterium]|nr:GNAT family N-acetyltransferase [Chitinophagales bacterium]
MTIEGYGVWLEPLDADHIEMVRQWRNSQKINTYMEYRDYISPEMQQAWFAKLNPLTDFYFLIKYNERYVGLIHTSNVDWQAGTAEAGLFIYEDHYLSTPIPVFASLSMVDAFFLYFPVNKLYAKVMTGNAVAEQYNQSLGFKLMPNQEGLQFKRFVLDKADYFASASQLRSAAQILERDSIKVHFDYSHYQALLAMGLQVSDNLIVKEDAKSVQ